MTDSCFSIVAISMAFLSCLFVVGVVVFSQFRLTDLGSIALNSPPDADDIGRREVSVDTDVSEV